MSESKIIPILLDIQTKIENPLMNSWNPFTKSYYTSLKDLLELIKPYLNENKLLLFQNTCSNDNGDLAVQTTLIHESGEKFSMGKMVIPLQHVNPQGLGSAITYGRRYQLTTLFNLVGEKDDDGNAGSKTTTSSKPDKSTSKPEGKPTKSQDKPDKPQGKPDKPQGKPNSSKPSNSKPSSKPKNKPVNKPTNKPSNTPANKPKVTESELEDGTKIQEAKGSKPGGKPLAEKVEDPVDENKLLAILQKEQSKLYIPLKKKFKTVKNRNAIKESHILQYCQELLGEGIYTPDDVGLVKETLDI